MSAQPFDPEPLVRSKFAVKDSFRLPDDELEFSVEYGPESRARFVELSRELIANGFTPRLVGSREETLLFVRRTRPAERHASLAPVVLFLLTGGSIVVFSLLLAGIYHQYGPSIPEVSVVASYALGVTAILAAHELGHRFASKRSGETPLAPSLVPGIPGVTGALPALGIVSRQKGPAVNRDRLFDVVLAGPLVALGVALLLYILGAAFSVQSAVPLQSCQQVNGTETLCPSVIQLGLNSLIGPLVPPVAAGYSALSPLADGGTVGLILTFVALLPIVGLDGGNLAGLVLGPGLSRAASYASVFFLILVDIPTYWALALVALLLMSLNRSSDASLLDEVSPLSSRRRWIFLGAVILALLCLPLPQTIAGFTLG